MHEIVIECNNYAGNPSSERCRASEEYIAECIQASCRLKSVTMHESMVQDTLIHPTITLRYVRGNHETLLTKTDEALSEIGMVAVRAIVSSIASRALEGAAVGGGVGLAAGRSSSGVSVGSTILGLVLGSLLGGIVEKRVLKVVAEKESGKWLARPIQK